MHNYFRTSTDSFEELWETIKYSAEKKDKYQENYIWRLRIKWVYYSVSVEEQ